MDLSSVVRSRFFWVEVHVVRAPEASVGSAFSPAMRLLLAAAGAEWVFRDAAGPCLTVNDGQAYQPAWEKQVQAPGSWNRSREERRGGPLAAKESNTKDKQ